MNHMTNSSVYFTLVDHELMLLPHCDENKTFFNPFKTIKEENRQVQLSSGRCTCLFSAFLDKTAS